MNYLIKYGLTDRFKNEASMFPEFKLGRIIAQYRGLYKIVTDDGEHLAEVSGRLRYETSEIEKFPTVGDFVMVTCENSQRNGIIHHILTRKSIFLRKAAGTKGQAQLIAANIDTVFICMSLNSNFNLSRLERCLSIAWDSGATPVILLTKSDLCEDLSKIVFQVEQVSAFSDVVTLSMYDGDTADKLGPFLKEGMTSAFIGSSGVGKSTLINTLLADKKIVTNETGRDDKGRHTTTGKEMFPCPLGGVLIDTPGMRELGIESADISKSFTEIDNFAQHCKFSDCSHTTEPGCEVRKALDNGLIDQRRLDNYFKLKHEAGYEGLNSKEIENKKLERMFKDVGGRKGVRDLIKEKRKR